MAKTDSFSFGVAGIGGRKYRVRDIVILPDGSVRRRRLGFWILSHHKFRQEELAELTSQGAETVVIGTGRFSLAGLSARARDYASEKGFELVALPSREAIVRYNELAGLGKKVGALLHIAC